MIRLLISLLFVAFFYDSAQSQSKNKYRKVHRYNIMKEVATIDRGELMWGRIYNDMGRIRIPFMVKDEIYSIVSYQSDMNLNRWIKKDDSDLFDISNNLIGTLCNTRTSSEDYPIYIFYGNSTIYYSIKQQQNSEWFSGRILSHSLTKNNSIVGVISHNKISRTFFNSRSSNGENFIYNVSSRDGGYSWESPDIAVKHNHQSLYAWCVTTDTEDASKCYMILTNSDNIPFISHSNDGGKNWSYPIKLSEDIKGDTFKLIVNRYGTVLTFRQTTDEDINDIMVWYGSLHQLVRDKGMGGNLVKVVDNKDNMEGCHTVEDIIHYNRRYYYLLYKKCKGATTSLIVHKVKFQR